MDVDKGLLSDLLLSFHVRLKAIEKNQPGFVDHPQARDALEYESELLLVKMFGPIITYPDQRGHHERRKPEKGRRKGD